MGNLVFRGRFMIVLSHLLQKTDLKHAHEWRGDGLCHRTHLWRRGMATRGGNLPVLLGK